MNTKLALVAVVAATCCALAVELKAGPAGDIKRRTQSLEFAGAGGKVFRYRLAEKTPADGSRVPLVLFLHGAGERGTNNVAQLVHGVGELVTWLEAHEKGFRLIAGQVPNGKRWVEVDWSAKSHVMPAEPSETMALLMEFLDRQLADPAIDLSRVYVTGISMGGYGTWDLLSRRPEVFAAAVPICGGGDVAQAQKMANVPIWTFHGSADNAVPVCRSRNMAAALWSAGSDAHYREYPDAGHNVWSRTYGDAEVLKWFFKQQKKDR
jgi:predicted peptidase